MAAPAAGHPVQNTALPAAAAAGPLGALVDGVWLEYYTETFKAHPAARSLPLRKCGARHPPCGGAMTGRSTVIVGWPSMGAGDAAVYENVNQKRSRPGDEQEVGCGTRGSGEVPERENRRDAGSARTTRYTEVEGAPQHYSR